MSGGPFIQFRVGRPGCAARYLRYIARKSAVLEGREGVYTQHLPSGVIEMPSFEALQVSLESYAWLTDLQERAVHLSASFRVYYACLMSFERDLETKEIKRTVGKWLRQCFPHARCAAFIHRDTRYPHVHLWLKARQVNGKKIDLSPRDYRALDEKWNALYAKVMGRSVQEHLHKKEERSSKKLFAHFLTHSEYQQRESRNAGLRKIEPVREEASERKSERTLEYRSTVSQRTENQTQLNDEPDQSRPRADQPEAARADPAADASKPPASSREPGLEGYARRLHETDQMLDQAAEAAQCLSQAVDTLAQDNAFKRIKGDSLEQEGRGR